MKEDKKNLHGLNIEKRIANLVSGLSHEKKQLLLDMIVEWQQKEQRNDPRIPCLIAVDYSTDRRAYRDFIQDLSKGGLFIETREPFKLEQVVSLTFTMPKTESHFKISGRIVRIDERGIAVELEKKLTQYQEDIIKSAIGSKK